MAKKVPSRAENINAEWDKLLPKDDDGKLLRTTLFTKAPKVSLVLVTMTLLATLEAENNALRELLVKQANRPE